MKKHALSGVKVLDLTHHIAGPYCTRILAGFGCNVIKVEKPGEGDMARKIGPFLNDEPGLERSGFFLYLNGGKKGITLNLKSAPGVKIFKELAQESDVVIENFSPGVMDRLGLGYQILEPMNTGLVMTSISNFGQDGPYRDYKSSHIVAWSMSGGRYGDGAPGDKPLQSGAWLTHYVAGIHGVVGTATALYHRSKTGVGQHVDVSILESTMLLSAYVPVVYSYFGIIHHAISQPFLGIFPVKDGYVGIYTLTEPQWEMLCAFFGMPELRYDPRFETPTLRRQNVDELKAILFPHMIEREKMELFQSGIEWRIPFTLVPTTREILDFPQHDARGFFEKVSHPVMGQVTMPGAPFKMMETPWQLTTPAPLLGEHNHEIYCDQLGYTKADLVRLREQGVI